MIFYIGAIAIVIILSLLVLYYYNMVETYKDAEQGFIYNQYLKGIGMHSLHPTDQILHNELQVKYGPLRDGLIKQQKDGSIKKRNPFMLDMEKYIIDFNKANTGLHSYDCKPDYHCKFGN